MPQRFHALSINYPGLSRELHTDIGVSDAFDYKAISDIKHDDSRIISSKALWDTGATNSAITKSFAQKVGLIPKGAANSSHAGGITVVPVYIIHVYLPNGIMLHHIRATEIADTVGKFDVIIGMDIITQGDFSLTNEGGKTCFSFRIPSIQKVDFVEEFNLTHKVSQGNAIPIVSRNATCPCGSGKKYKNCHGKND